VPFPAIAQGLSRLLLLLGGLSIVFGIYPFAGIVLLVASLVPASLMMHDLWELDDLQARMADKITCTKNLALIGAVLMLLAIPSPWPLSLVP
jgi:putative oxidoreductase